MNKCETLALILHIILGAISTSFPKPMPNSIEIFVFCLIFIPTIAFLLWEVYESYHPPPPPEVVVPPLTLQEKADKRVEEAKNSKKLYVPSIYNPNEIELVYMKKDKPAELPPAAEDHFRVSEAAKEESEDDADTVEIDYDLDNDKSTFRSTFKTVFEGNVEEEELSVSEQSYYTDDSEEYVAPKTSEPKPRMQEWDMSKIAKFSAGEAVGEDEEDDDSMSSSTRRKRRSFPVTATPQKQTTAPLSQQQDVPTHTHKSPKELLEFQAQTHQALQRKDSQRWYFP
jgi:hypothetical protein